MASSAYGFAVSNLGLPSLEAFYQPRSFDTGAISPVSVAANTTAEQTFTVTGIDLNDVVWISKPTAQTGLGVGMCRVSAVNTLAITFINNSGAGIVPTAGETYLVVACKCV